MAFSLSGAWSKEPILNAYEIDSPWLGHFWALPGEDWIYHAEHGWLFTSGPDAHDGSILIHDAGLGDWLWTTRELYPFLYSFSASNPGWLYFYPETSRWYYSFDAQDYIHAAPN